MIKKNSIVVPKAIPLAASPHCLTSTGIYTQKYTYIPTKANRHVARDETVRLTEYLMNVNILCHRLLRSQTRDNTSLVKGCKYRKEQN